MNSVEHHRRGAYEFGTRAVHSGRNNQLLDCVAINHAKPQLDSSFVWQTLEKGFEFQCTKFRHENRKCLETALANLEGANFGLVFSSGVATATSIMHLLKPSDHVICGKDGFGGMKVLIYELGTRMGIEVTFVDATDIENVKNVTHSNTKMIWMESPTNPTMKLCDIRALAAFAKTKSGLFVVIDNTFMTPYFQKPLELGADIAMYSATKYINGHSDVTMGAALTNRCDLYEQLQFIQTCEKSFDLETYHHDYFFQALAAAPSPFDCFLVNRGLKTLHLRMRQHMKNGLAVAHFLEKHPMVKQVLYPGLSSHAQHKLALRQCLGFSGMLSFYFNGNKQEANVFAQNLKYFISATSLGGIQSLIQIEDPMKAEFLPFEQRPKSENEDVLIRLSVGIEDTTDLIEDLKKAFNTLQLSKLN